MSRPQFTSLRLSLLALAVSATLPTFAFATETMTVTATGNARSSFEAPMIIAACWFLSMVFARERIPDT